MNHVNKLTSKGLFEWLESVPICNGKYTSCIYLLFSYLIEKFNKFVLLAA